MLIVKKLFTVFGIVLTAADIISDIVLAVDYCVTDNPWWCGLTWTFIAVPAFIRSLLLCGCFCEDDDNSDLTKSELWKFWKGFEICFESGPQLLLQLYIMAITDLDSTATSGKMKPKQNVL